MKLERILGVLNESEDSTEVMNQLLLDQLGSVKELFVFALQTRVDPEISKSITTCYESLAPRHQARLLTSAEFCELMQIPKGESDTITGGLKGLSDHAWQVATVSCIEREAAIQSISRNKAPHLRTTPDVVWSAAGDVYAMHTQSDDWKICNQPLLGDLIVVDYESPMSYRTDVRSGVLSRPRQSFTDAERTSLERKLATALKLIDTLVPTYGLLIRNFTRRIIVRKSIDKNGACAVNSEHVPRQPGAIRLLNPQVEEHSVESVMEQLLHESVHNFLAAWEMANTHFYASNDNYRPVSPWSGNLIPNPSLAHAVFVYYACLHLFNKYYNYYGGKSDRMTEVRKRLSVFAVGFLIRRQLSDLFLSNECYTPELADTINGMQRLVRGMQHHSVA